MTVKAVFFDMGGTLQTFWHTRELRLSAMPGMQRRLREAGIDLGLSDEALLDLIASRWEAYHAWGMQTLEELPALRVWREFILPDVPAAAHLTEDAAETLMFYYETQLYCREVRPEVAQVLAALKAMGLKMAVISNVCGRHQVKENLRDYGLLEYFDPIVLSSEYGRRKPDPALFHYAARLANVPASDCIYVGDRVNRDVLGAKRAGFRLAVQIRHDFKHGEKDEGAVPDVVISDMRELVDIVRHELANPQPRPQPPAVRAVLFDAGDILYYRPDRDQPLHDFLRRVVGEVREIQPEAKAVLNARAHSGLISQDEFRRETLRLYGVTRAEELTLGATILEAHGNNVAFFPGVKETLLTLKERGYYLGIITDTAHSISQKIAWFEKGGFGHVWDTIISSFELETTKPDPRIYHAALQQLGVPPHEAVFVGHKPSELDGARSVGIHTVAFNHDLGAQAEVFIENFGDLIGLPLLVGDAAHA